MSSSFITPSILVASVVIFSCLSNTLCKIRLLPDMITCKIISPIKGYKSGIPVSCSSCNKNIDITFSVYDVDITFSVYDVDIIFSVYDVDITFSVYDVDITFSVLPNQGFLLVKLKSSLRKFYGRNHDLIDRYGISVSQMTTDMFHLS